MEQILADLRYLISECQDESIAGGSGYIDPSDVDLALELAREEGRRYAFSEVLARLSPILSRLEALV